MRLRHIKYETMFTLPLELGRSLLFDSTLDYMLDGISDDFVPRI